LLAGGITSDANGQAMSAAQAHVAAAMADVSPSTPNAKPWQSYGSLFKLVCTQPKAGAKPPFVGAGEPEEKRSWCRPARPVVRAAGSGVRQPYYIGTQTESTWALTTSAGIILLNTNFPWVTPELLNELKTFGLDPANIKYAIVVRSHSDQSWASTR